MKGRIGLWVAVLGMAAAIAAAQTAGGQAVGSVLGGVITSTTGPGITQSTPGMGTYSMPTAMFTTGAISGAPYSGEQVSQMVQTLADGTHITRNMSSQKTWRDSQGRTRTERQMGPVTSRPNAPKPLVIIEIRDPVAGMAYLLDTQGKVAHRITMQQRPGMAATRPINPTMAQMSRGVMTSSSATGDGVETRTESLGNQSIEGVMALGTRTTTVYPVNYDGNDRPITTTTEIWNSPELGLMVLMKRNDPRNGENTQKIVNLSRNEPDITLFQPPSDYSVVDETGPTVTIRYALQ